MAERFAGRVAVVTGAASGIGAAVAARLLEGGARVVGVDRRPGFGPDNPAFHALVADIATEDGCDAFVAAAQARFGGLHLLAHCAGVIGAPKPVAEIDVDEFDRMIRVNLRGTMLVLRAVLRDLRGREVTGAICCVTSIAAHRTTPRMAAYGASKRGMNALIVAAAKENGAAGIRVNGVAPGMIDTPLIRPGRDTISPRLIEQAKATPLGRPGRPDEAGGAGRVAAERRGRLRHRIAAHRRWWRARLTVFSRAAHSSPPRWPRRDARH
ncbi:MAG: SDR family oxidoreductase [Sphingomonadaceae bacterium]|nr:SDR family oxidoreductase [Sphingomonadaceae bacterium]